ncbi:MAG: bifunctional phosphoglucose/phosphomannose isomerase [Candidatus Saganbacteria bacterium]|nr:bifunctional phosphoglucose/phosphomannose isomerase [Candidatus Saganbacteria bacterium]
MAAKHDILDDREQLARLDSANMLATLAKMPEMLAEARRLAGQVELKKSKKPRQIVIAGMGGSAIAGDILADLFAQQLKLPLTVNRDYRLPAYVGPETLVMAVSYSGNTEETLAAAKDTLNQGCRLIVITSGGQLAQLAQEHGLTCFPVPKGYQPRAALPFLFLPLLTVLASLDLIAAQGDALDELEQLLTKLVAEYEQSVPQKKNPAKQVAQRLVAKIPLILGSSGTTAAAALRLKTQLNENSKTTAHVAVFPELDHNEIVNLADLKRGEHAFALLALRSENDSERMKKRIEITKSLIGGQLGGIIELPAKGKTDLSRLFSLVILGDYISVYLALLRAVDPSDVTIITRLKKELSR